MDQHYILLDGVQRNREHPTTFHIPTAEEKAALKIGDYVKLGFMPAINGRICEAGITERMWVKVTGTDYGFTGTIANDPVVFTGILAYGDSVWFDTENVLSIMGDE